MNPRHSKPLYSIKAFTLIELLAVIAVIGILMSLFFTGTSRVSEQGKTARCVSNLRQQGLTIFAYASDNKGVGYPTYYDNKGAEHWGAQIHVLVANGYISESGHDSLTDTISDNSSIFRCPSGADDRPAFNGALNGAQGSSTEDEELNRPGRWEPFPPINIPGTKRYYDSWYSWNADAGETASVPLSAGTRLNAISRPAKVVLVTDGAFALHLANNIRISSRHGPKKDKTNVLFADNHVETILIRDLFDATTRKFTTNYVWNTK
jgi:prepilin-type N-terminal cleavage/methylation domain-containing protein/prepilin-type processing-associated H-X9-DG protein